MHYSATYSPDDNKLRLTATARLDADTYAQAKSAGFRWAPKQGNFYATWTPHAEDFCIELAGEIDDDDKTLTERAEERADRFDGYSESRQKDADAAHKQVQQIGARFEFGQPILIGHHSEKKARKDQERIENGMRKAVKAFETAEYWQRRAAGALANAQYKERSDVRARRIKSIESDKRKQERYKTEAEKWLKLWNKDGLTLDQAQAIANFCRLTVTRINADGTQNINGGWSAYDVLRPEDERYKACPSKTVEECQEAARKAYPRAIAHYDRWITHYNNRLIYERAMLADQGGTVADRQPLEIGGAVQCSPWSPRGGWSYIVKVNRVTVTIRHQWASDRIFNHNEPITDIRAIMTRAEVEEARANGKLKETENKTGFHVLQSREEFDQANPPKPEPAAEKIDAAPFDAMRATLKAGIQIVTAPQLFPTPRELAARMIDAADIQPGARVLEPSAGTGALLGAMGGRMFGHDPERGTVFAVEINAALCENLKREFPLTCVVCHDFLQWGNVLAPSFDRIVMNPPFANADDIKHIQHAAALLAPGGRLVALCANGPRQRETLKEWTEESGGTWEDLPAGSFKEQGTGVNVAMLVYEAPEQTAEEKKCRDFWTAKGVPEDKQNELVAAIAEKAKPGAFVGPFQIPQKIEPAKPINRGQMALL